MASTGFDYPNISPSNPPIQTHMINPIHGFQSNAEIFNLPAGMDMIGFSKHLQSPSQPAAGPSSSSSSKMVAVGDCYFTKPADQFSSASENLMVASADAAAWQESRSLVNESNSFRSSSCVFPCEGNERPSQGLSLSLSSNNPSGIALQTFELRQANHRHHEDIRFGLSSNTRDGVFGKFPESQQQMMQDGFEGKSINFYQHEGQFQLKNSRYLGPSQELLKEFCSPGITQNDLQMKNKHLMKSNSCEDQESGNSSLLIRIQSLSSLDFTELQRRKAKLFSLLEEVDKRYRHYRDQMKGVVSSFEAVAGNGSANVYSALASKTMSRHFRRLRDAIVDEIQVTKKAMGEKDEAVPAGTTRGETPRLKILDQKLRQQRAFQQMSMMETHPWRPQRGLPERAVTILRAWLFEHFLHPYPTDVDKHILARQTGLSRSQVSNWFINARVRLWKPMVEEMYLEELKENDDNTTSSDHHYHHLEEGQPSQNPNEDIKPTQEQLLGRDDSTSDQCLSSIIISNRQENSKKELEKKNSTSNGVDHHHHHHHSQSVGRVGSETFGAVDLDFSSYNQHHHGGTVAYDHNNNNNYNGGGVSLTLGLQQHGGSSSGVNLDFSSAASHHHHHHQSSPFYHRDDHIDEDCQQLQFSLMEAADQTQSFPYRNMMGAQLLHDFAG